MGRCAMVTFRKRGACWPGAAAAVLAAAGCTRSQAPAPGTGPPAASRAGPLAAAVTSSFPARFIGVAEGVPSGRLAVYSSVNGHRLKFLTANLPGGGPAGPGLSADGGTVVFSRGQGSCAQTIDTPRTFAITGTLVHLGSCLDGEGISLAEGDPSAILAET